MYEISVVVPSHNTRIAHITRVIEGLRMQTLPLTDWELVVVDDASREPLAPKIDVSWHPNGRVSRNEAPEEDGCLVLARLRGINETTASILIFVDDDNVLAPDYLENALRIAREYPMLGAWGGQIELEYENPSLRLPAEMEGLLCFRKLTKPLWSNVTEHYDSTPWGAGMCIRRQAAENYRERLRREPDRVRLDPNGRGMGFGGDVDLVESALLIGMGKGVFPELSLLHLIPPQRCDPKFLARCLEAHGYSTTLHGWLDNGYATAPRTDIRFWVNEALRYPFRNKWQRLKFHALRRGAWKAYRDLLGSKPCGLMLSNSKDTQNTV